jgi:hypothetical protein
MHKVADPDGVLLVSYVDAEDGVCHARTCLSVQKYVRKNLKVEDVVCRARATDSLRGSMTAKSAPRIHKIVVAADIDISQVTRELERFYNGRKLIAVCMQIRGQKRQVWLNPTVLQKIDEIKAAQARVNDVKSNGGQGLHFFEKLLKLQEVDLTVEMRETPGRLQVELDNFRKPFPLAW